MSPVLRGRVVMLVDNDVSRDSRVQKEARSAADKGWDVVLLGTARPGRITEWKLGEAQVRLLKVRYLLRHRRHLLRRGPLRAPLSYNRPVMARYRKQLVKAQKVDLQTRRAIHKIKSVGRESALTTRAVNAFYFVQRARLALFGRWVGLRAAKTVALEKRRQNLASPIDRFTTAFWEKTMGDRSWRRLDPSIWDWELTFGPAIDKLKPDIIHANDFRMLGVGSRAMLRARAEGRSVKLVWDAHEYLPGLGRHMANTRWHPAQVANEREFVHFADAVTTVSDVLADILVDEYGLPEKPAVVMNTPYSEPLAEGESIPTVREVAGLDPDVPILIYSGGVTKQRGTGIMIEALPHLPGVHVILVSATDHSEFILELIARAHELGAGDRLHILPYAEPQHVVHYVSSANVGVHPTQHFPNHEISLATKFFEYSHARLPIVVSDVKTMSEKVYETGQGEVFVAEDLEDYVRAVKAVLADPDRYRAAYDKPGLLAGWTWESQADILDEVYGKLKPRPSN